VSAAVRRKKAWSRLSAAGSAPHHQTLPGPRGLRTVTIRPGLSHPQLHGRDSALHPARAAGHAPACAWHVERRALHRLEARQGSAGVSPSPSRNFPLWLAPDQVRVLPVTEAQIDYARGIVNQLRAQQVHAELEFSSAKLMGYIQRAEEARVHHVVGQREEEADAVARRFPGKGEQGVEPRAEVVARYSARNKGTKAVSHPLKSCHDNEAGN